MEDYEVRRASIYNLVVADSCDREARHPNVVLYLGLSRAPAPDGRIFIISEFIECGNLRQYIHNKNKPFGWRLRLSFMTDIARALAYLHARKVRVTFLYYI
jgi:LIM domain kinase 1